MSIHKHEAPLHRAPDHSTSIKAAAKTVGDLSLTQNKVLSALVAAGAFGMTDSEIQDRCNKLYGKRAESSWRKRRTDLVRLGFVCESDQRRTNSGGNIEKVWCITNKEIT